MLREDIIRQLPFFSGLSAEQLDLLRARGESLGRMAAGETLFEAGDEVKSVFFALDLRKRPSPMPIFVRLEIPAAPPAKPLRFDRIVETELFGETEFFAEGLSPAYGQRAPVARRRETRAELLTAADLVSVPITVLSQIIEHNSTVRHRLVRLGARRLKNALTAQMRRRHLDLDASLADHLLDLASDYGTFYGNYAVFNAKFGQAEIAEELGVSRRALTERLKAWSEAGLVRTTPLTLLDVRRIRQMERIGNEAPASLITSAADEITEVINAGDLASGRALALDLIKFFPSSGELAYCAALAAARAGRSDDANAILSAAGLLQSDPTRLSDRVLFGLLRPEAPVPDAPPPREELDDMIEGAGIFDADEDDNRLARTAAVFRARMRHLSGEIISLRGRIAKDEALATGATKDAVAAAEFYAAALVFADPIDVFPATNAASMFKLAGQHQRAQDLARRVVGAGRRDDYWTRASMIEAHLLLGQQAEALEAARTAMEAPHSDGMVASTRRQLRRLEQVLGPGALEALETLKVRRPFVFSGTMIREGQFDVEADKVEGFIHQAVREFLNTHNVGAAYGPLARGADIVVAEAVIEAGLELHAVLPFDIEAFIEESVMTGDAASARWRERFEDVITRCTAVTIVQPGRPLTRDLDISFRHGFRYAAAQTIERAADLETTPLLYAITARGPSGELAGTSADIADWQRSGHEVVRIDMPFRKLTRSGPAHLKHGFSPCVFFFPDPGDTVPAMDRVASVVGERGIVPLGLIERRIKDGRLGAAAVLGDFETALDLAFALQSRKHADTGREGRVICDYGPVLGRSGSPDEEMVARLPAASDFAGFPTDRVLAAAPFAREMQFAPEHRVTTIPSGQRAHRSTERGRVRIVPAIGVYALLRDDQSEAASAVSANTRPAKSK